MLTLEEHDRDAMLDLLSDFGSTSPDLMLLELTELNKLRLLELLKLWLFEQLQNEVLEFLVVDILEQQRLILDPLETGPEDKRNLKS